MKKVSKSSLKNLKTINLSLLSLSFGGVLLAPTLLSVSPTNYVALDPMVEAMTEEEKQAYNSFSYSASEIISYVYDASVMDSDNPTQPLPPQITISDDIQIFETDYRAGYDVPLTLDDFTSIELSLVGTDENHVLNAGGALGQAFADDIESLIYYGEHILIDQYWYDFSFEEDPSTRMINEVLEKQQWVDRHATGQVIGDTTWNIIWGQLGTSKYVEKDAADKDTKILNPIYYSDYLLEDLTGPTVDNSGAPLGTNSSNQEFWSKNTEATNLSYSYDYSLRKDPIAYSKTGDEGKVFNVKRNSNDWSVGVEGVDSYYNSWEYFAWLDKTFQNWSSNEAVTSGALNASSYSQLQYDVRLVDSSGIKYNIQKETQAIIKPNISEIVEFGAIEASLTSNYLIMELNHVDKTSIALSSYSLNYRVTKTDGDLSVVIGAITDTLVWGRNQIDITELFVDNLLVFEDQITIEIYEDGAEDTAYVSGATQVEVYVPPTSGGSFLSTIPWWLWIIGIFVITLLVIGLVMLGIWATKGIKKLIHTWESKKDPIIVLAKKEDEDEDN